MVQRLQTPHERRHEDASSKLDRWLDRPHWVRCVGKQRADQGAVSDRSVTGVTRLTSLCSF